MKILFLVLVFNVINEFLNNMTTKRKTMRIRWHCSCGGTCELASGDLNTPLAFPMDNHSVSIVKN